MIDIFPSVTWAGWHNIIFFPFFFFGIFLVIYRYIKQRKISELLAGVGSKNGLLVNNSLFRQKIRAILLTVAILFLAIALLRPQWNEVDQAVNQQGRDLYIALDISRSMLAVDCKPNRLAYAKQKIKSLVAKLSCERVGLIVFSGASFVQCPLTTDYSAFYLYLDSVDVEMISSGTTSLSSAITMALDSFESSSSRKNKLLVLFTDGEDFSQDLAQVKEEVVKNNLSIFTVGVGTTQGAPVPTFDMHGSMIGHQKDAHGTVVISRLNEALLQGLSSQAGGKYIKSVDTDDDIKELIVCVEKKEKESFQSRTISLHEDQYHYCIVISFICFLCEWLL